MTNNQNCINYWRNSLAPQIINIYMTYIENKFDLFCGLTINIPIVS